MCDSVRASACINLPGPGKTVMEPLVRGASRINSCLEPLVSKIVSLLIGAGNLQLHNKHRTLTCEHTS